MSEMSNFEPVEKSTFHLPDEILEKVFTYFFQTTRTDLKDRTAILRTCEKWYRIAHPILWQDIALVESQENLPKITALSHLFSIRRHRGSLTKAFSLSIEDYNIANIKTTSPNDRRTCVFFEGLKSASVSLENFRAAERVNEAISFLRKVVGGLVISEPDAFHFRIGTVHDDEGIWEPYYSPLMLDVTLAMKKAIYFRLELPPSMITSVLESRRLYSSLKSIVLCWTEITEARHGEELAGWHGLFLLFEKISCGDLPNLEKALILQPSTVTSFQQWLSRRCTSLEKDLTFDTLLGESLVDAYKKIPPTRYSSEPMTKNLTDLGKQTGVERWRHNARCGHEYEVQDCPDCPKARFEFKTFSSENEVLFDLVLNSEGFTWASLAGGGTMPWPLAVERGLVCKQTGLCRGAKHPSQPWRNGVLLMITSGGQVEEE